MDCTAKPRTVALCRDGDSIMNGWRTERALEETNELTVHWSAGEAVSLTPSSRFRATAELKSVSVIGAPSMGDDRFRSTNLQQAIASSTQMLSALYTYGPSVNGELKISIQPKAASSPRMRIYVSVSSSDSLRVARAALKAMLAVAPRSLQFSEGALHTPQGLHNDILELRRQVILEPPAREWVKRRYGMPVVFSLGDSPGDGSGWPSLYTALQQAEEPTELSIVFSPAGVTSQETEGFRSYLGRIRTASETHIDRNLRLQDRQYLADEVCRRALSRWERAVEHLDQPLLLKISLRGASDSLVSTATAVAAALCSADKQAAPRKLIMPRTIDEHARALLAHNTMQIVPWGEDMALLAASVDPTLERLPFIHGLREVATLHPLPTPGIQGVIGITRGALSADEDFGVIDRDVPEGSRTIRLGEVQGTTSHVLHVTAGELNRHVLVAGSSGSGKTSTVLSILEGSYRELGIPFLVVEPAKTEYRRLLRTLGTELDVYTIGRGDMLPLRLNILEPLPGTPRDVQVSRVMMGFKLALPLFEPMPILLEDAVLRCYEDLGWGPSTTIEDGLPVPTLRTLIDAALSVFAASRYVGEAKNMETGLINRLRSMTRGLMGQLLDTQESTDLARLLTRPTVLEFSHVIDPEQRKIMIALVLSNLRAAMERRGPGPEGLAHLTVLEEAHEILTPAGTTADSNGAPPNAELTLQQFASALVELRAAGEGFIVATQDPLQVIPEVRRNTSLKIVHQVAAHESRQNFVLDAGLPADSAPILNDLKRGQALISGAEHKRAVIATIYRPATEHGVPMRDQELMESPHEHLRLTQALLPYSLCHHEMCPLGCDPQIRTSAARLIGPLREAKDPSDLRSAARNSGLAKLGRQGLWCGIAQSHASAPWGSIAPTNELRTGLIDALDQGLFESGFE